MQIEMGETSMIGAEVVVEASGVPGEVIEKPKATEERALHHEQITAPVYQGYEANKAAERKAKWSTLGWKVPLMVV